MESLIEKYLHVRAPGRINLLGEHLDYNHGVVLPAAIDKCFDLEFKPLPSATFRILALDIEEQLEFQLSELNSLQTEGWKNYVKGVFILLGIEQCAPNLKNGLQISISSSIPIGAGLSSSAALCCGLAFGLNAYFELGKSKMELALIAQQTEHQFAGVQCGLMDQVASLFGKPNQLMAFDCLSQEVQHFSLPLKGAQLFLVDSRVKHNLAESAYNKRRQQLEAAFEIAQQLFPDLNNWRALSSEMRGQLRSIIDSETAARLTYVLDEMQRVSEVQELCHHLDLDIHNDHTEQVLKNLGSLLSQTHVGLKDLYEVSCEELDFLQTKITSLPYVYGARMMGGGFGGCLLVLAAQEFEPTKDLAATFEHYFEKFDIHSIFYPIQIANGVHLITHD
ncbi:MAG: hypothetical protein RLZZ65_1128 [Bacteroidota bacterium]|jgi:galactokinase